MTKVNIARSIKLSSILSGKVPKPSLYEKKLEQMGEFLFFYSAWTFVQNRQAATLTESQVEGRLKEFPEMEVVFCYLLNSSPEVPAILKGRKITKEEITGHEALSELIYHKTGAHVDESDLRTKQVNKSSSVPILAQVRRLNEIAAREKWGEDTKARILKCLQESDPRKKAECLKKCNLK